MFGPTDCKYFRDFDTRCRDDNSYISILCKLCPNDINNRVRFHTNGKPTNFAEWQRKSLTPEEFEQIQWIRDPTDYYSSKNKLHKPLSDTNVKQTHEHDTQDHDASDTAVEINAKQMSNPYIVNPDVSLFSMCPPCPVPLVKA